jgi:hypothetical protein
MAFQTPPCRARARPRPGFHRCLPCFVVESAASVPLPGDPGSHQIWHWHVPMLPLSGSSSLIRTSRLRIRLPEQSCVRFRHGSPSAVRQFLSTGRELRWTAHASKCLFMQIQIPPFSIQCSAHFLPFPEQPHFPGDSCNGSAVQRCRTERPIAPNPASNVQIFDQLWFSQSQMDCQ